MKATIMARRGRNKGRQCGPDEAEGAAIALEKRKKGKLLFWRRRDNCGVASCLCRKIP